MNIKESIKEIKKNIQSTHVNFLIGAGLSTPFLPLLEDIEKRLSDEKMDQKEKVKAKKDYFKKVMIPNIDIIDSTVDSNKEEDFLITINNYKNFFELISYIILKRKNTILSKQVNIFTTNIDILMENALEKSGLEYNDGFNGRINPTFSISNFKKSLFKKSLHFENTSEIPIINLMKIHGSLTWNRKVDQIFFSKLEHLDKEIIKKSDEDFELQYKKIAIVNPEKKKLEETVIDIYYYELLRVFSSELEKENAILFIMGFSMNDEHIKEIVVRAAESNPTLKVYIFCYDMLAVGNIRDKINLEKLRYLNIEIIEPINNKSENLIDLSMINEKILRVIKADINGYDER